MTALVHVWLPVVVSAIALFFASFLAWAVLPHHKPDFRKWPDEERLLAFLRDSRAEPGQYVFPMMGHGRPDSEATRRYAEGPWGLITLWPGAPGLAANMAKTVALFLVVNVVIAYVAAQALPPGAGFSEVFRFVAPVAVLTYTAGGVLNEIWFTKPLRAKLMDALDGLVYGLINGALFGWLWPG
jgi:hypothetical protein